MKRMLVALTAAVALALALGACGGTSSVSSGGTGSTSSSGPVTVTDALGRQVSFPAPPQRIVITGKAMFFITDAAYLFPQASSRIVALGKGVQYKLDFAPVVDKAYASKTIFSMDAGVDQIVAAKPDAVFLKTFSRDSIGRSLEALKIKVVYFDLETPEAYAKELGTMGQLLGDPGRGQSLVSWYQKKVDHITSVVASATGKPRVLVLYYSSKNGSVGFNVSPPSWINAAEVRLAGGDPVWTTGVTFGKGWTLVSLEQIARWNPDQVYVITYFSDPEEAVARIKADPRWKSLDAVQNNAVYAFPGDYYSWDQPDTRWILGLAWLATKIHPEQAGAINIDAEARAFYQDLYRMDSAAYDKSVKPNLWGDLP